MTAKLGSDVLHIAVVPIKISAGISRKQNVRAQVCIPCLEAPWNVDNFQIPYLKMVLTNENITAFNCGINSQIQAIDSLTYLLL